jgi:hypothetical protein
VALVAIEQRREGAPTTPPHRRSVTSVFALLVWVALGFLGLLVVALMLALGL